VILNYNGKDYLANCLSSVLDSDYPNFEIILVDNDSTDGSLQIADNFLRKNLAFSIIRNSINLGYAEGNDIGARNARGRYLAFLNVDTRVDSLWLKEAIEALEEDREIGIVQCKVLLMDDSTVLDNVGHYIDSLGITYFLGRLEKDRGQYNNAQEVFGAYGAAFIVRSEVFSLLKGFDTDFFILFEESDLCWRAWIAGYRVLYVPGAKVYHKGGASYKRKDYSETTYFFVRNRLMALLKNCELRKVLTIVPTSVMIMMALSFAKMINGRPKEAIAVTAGIFWNLRNLAKVIVKRREVNRTRITSNDDLIRRGIIKRFNIWRAIDKAHSLLE
jgi:GT2 family glycosyltransferase